MSILSRFSDIISSNVNALLDKAEDPAKMVDQYLINLRKDLASVKEGTAEVIAEEKRTKRLLDENNANITKYTELAKKAIQAGNDEDAKAFLAKKQSLEANHPALQSAYDNAAINANKMRQMHDKIVNDIQILENKKASIKATVAVAKTKQRINKITAASSSGATMDAFDRMEKKAANMLDKAEAEEELNKGSSDDMQDLEQKYSGASSFSVDDELARMKAEMLK